MYPFLQFLRYLLMAVFGKMPADTPAMLSIPEAEILENSFFKGKSCARKRQLT